MSQLKGEGFVPIPLGGFGLIKREVRWLYESAKWKDGQTDSEGSLWCPCFSYLFMTGHNDKSNTLSLVAFCCLCTILSFSLWASIQIKCHVCFCGEWKFVLSEFCKLVSTCCAALTCEGLFCLYVVIFTDVFGLRWCFLWVCVFAVFYTCVLSPFRCCCCNGAQQGRGATLCESDRTIFTPPPCFFHLFLLFSVFFKDVLFLLV